MTERTPTEWNQMFWDIVMYEPAHDARLMAAARYIILGEESLYANNVELDYLGLRAALRNDYGLTKVEFDHAFASAERTIERDIFNGQA